MAKAQSKQAALVIVEGDSSDIFLIDKSEMTIGRKKADIVLADPNASGTHARILLTETGPILEDLASTNGTFLNGRPITKAVLSDQDVVQIGQTTLKFYVDISNLGASDDVDASRSTQNDTVVTKTAKILPTVTEIKVLEGPAIGKSFSFKKSHITIGRSGTDIVLPDHDVSRSHALLEIFSATRAYLRDLGSTNGTYWNEVKITTQNIQSGDKIKVGGSELEIRFFPAR